MNIELYNANEEKDLLLKDFGDLGLRKVIYKKLKQICYK
jgi:hypothetical protein